MVVTDLRTVSFDVPKQPIKQFKPVKKGDNSHKELTVLEYILC